VDYNIIWNRFLARIKQEIQPINYETWFEETKLIEIKNNYAKILVPMTLHKKHLKEAYNEIVTTIFNEITESNFFIDYVTEDELENNIVIDTDKIGIPVDNFETNLDSKYTFDNFIIGKSNKFAKMNAVAVAERPGQIYNPMFIYGPSGVGKTHLMQAIGNYIVQNSNKKVLYVTSEKFVNDFLKIYRDKKESDNFTTIDEFKNKYRDIDVLIIDDIQYLEIAKTTQQEFFNTFNELHSKNKQIIISSDRSPNDLKKLEDRLLTRFSWGLSVDIIF
jgi:chromosomal replication initiator protein